MGGEYMENISTRLKKIRQVLKLSQEQLAKNLNISKQAISNMENAKSLPSIPVLYKLLVDFHVNINYLLSGDGSAFMEDEKSFKELRNSIINEVEKILEERGLGK